MIFIGESVFPVLVAGQTDEHRAHSVHDTESKSCFHVKSFTLLAPRLIFSISASGSSIILATCMGRRIPRFPRLVMATLATTAMAWNILVMGRMAINNKEAMACDHQAVP